MAAWRAIVSAVAVVCAFLAPVESQNVVVEPVNFGATTGDQNVLIRCSVTSLGVNYIELSYNPFWSSTDVLIYYSFFNNASLDPANFSVNPYVMENVNYVDLTIKTVQLGLGAQYTCSLNPAIDLKAVSALVVLDPLECPESYIEYGEGDVANFSCSVNYTTRLSGSQTPQLTWQLNGVNQPGGVYEDDPSGARRTLTLRKPLTVEDDDQEYMCIATVANSQPSYTNNCSTVVYVLHGVSEVYFYPTSSPENPATVAVGETINCTANGRPEPKIIWTDIDMAILSETGELTVTEEMRSWEQPVTLYCVANNTASEANGSYTFKVGDAAMVQSAGVEPWVIAVAVIVPIVVLTAIAIAVYFIVRHRKKKQQANKKPINGSSVARPPTTTGATIYTPVATSEVPFASPSRPPPTTGPGAGSLSSNRGPPGPDSRNGGNSPGYGDLGVRPYGGSVHGSNPTLIGTGISMNPNPASYPVRGSNQALNVSTGSNQRPNYPYTGSNSALNASLSLGPNPNGAPVIGVGRQPSVASSSGRSHASSYNAGLPPMDANRYPNDLSSMHGSEV